MLAAFSNWTIYGCQHYILCWCLTYEWFRARVSFQFKIYTSIFFISRTDEEETNIRLFHIILWLCPKLKKVIKSFDGDKDLMKYFLQIVLVSQHMRIYFIIGNIYDPSQLSTASSNSRTEDTDVLELIIANYINLDPSEPVKK